MRTNVFYIHLVFVYQTIAATKPSQDAHHSQRARTKSYSTVFNSAMIIQNFIRNLLSYYLSLFITFFNSSRAHPPFKSFLKVNLHPHPHTQLLDHMFAKKVIDTIKNIKNKCLVNTEVVTVINQQSAQSSIGLCDTPFWR